MKAPLITASQDISHRPWARRTRLCWVNVIFSSMAHYYAQATTEKREKKKERGSWMEQSKSILVKTDAIQRWPAAFMETNPWSSKYGGLSVVGLVSGQSRPGRLISY